MTAFPAPATEAERKALAGIHAVLAEFEEKHDRVTDFPVDDYFVAR